jgi:hypothetical protein
MPDPMIDRRRVKKEMDALIEMITHPAFVGAMKQMKETPVAERRALAKDVLAVDTLKSAGVKMPRGMRVTTRYFEPGKTQAIQISPEGRVTTVKLPKELVSGRPGGVLSWGGCACGGGLTFCGGAGGST